jgi:transcriptional regulator with XRE-family HTH domain
MGITNFKDLGGLIKAVRQSNGIRQEDISDALGFSRNYLREIESGKPNLFASRLFRTLNKLGIRVTVTYELPKSRQETNASQTVSEQSHGN